MALYRVSCCIDGESVSCKASCDPAMPYSEKKLRELMDPPTNRMIDLWDQACITTLKKPVEIVVDDRRNDPIYRSWLGEVNTASPGIHEGRVVLYVLVDSFPRLRPIVISHEIGHWVLILRGFRALQCIPRNIFRESLLNSLAGHPSLFRLQKQLGDDPQNEIDLRCGYDRRQFSRPRQIDSVNMALLLADDLLNCSFDYREPLRRVLRKSFPDTLRLTERVVCIASDHDLYDFNSNVEFRRTLIKDLNLGNWVVCDHVKSLEDLILEKEKKTSQ
jgi:hypothetical protein